jgi:hypothetical protein
MERMAAKVGLELSSKKLADHDGGIDPIMIGRSKIQRHSIPLLQFLFSSVLNVIILTGHQIRHRNFIKKWEILYTAHDAEQLKEYH